MYHVTVAMETGNATFAMDIGNVTVAMETGNATVATETGNVTVATETGNVIVAMETCRQQHSPSDSHEMTLTSSFHGNQRQGISSSSSQGGAVGTML